MNTIKFYLTLSFSFLVLYPCTVLAEPETPLVGTQVLERVIQAYQNIQTLEIQGQTNSLIDDQGTRFNLKVSFVMRFKRPDRFIVVWNREGGAQPAQKGAVWSAGKGGFLYIESYGAYTGFEQPAEALAVANGISGGITGVIPSLVLQQPSVLGSFKNSKVITGQKLDGQDVLLLESESSVSKAHKLWIDPKSFLIRKIAYAYDGANAVKMSQASDAELVPSLQSAGQAATPENLKELRAALEQNEKLLEGVKTEVEDVFVTIRTGKEFADTEFQFKMPPKTFYSKTLVDGLYQQ